MLDATKYINRLRVVIKGADELEYKKDWEKFDYLYHRVSNIVKDYDEDFDNAMEDMEKQEMFNMKRDNPFKEGTE
jgi:hypothetical protein